MGSFAAEEPGAQNFQEPFDTLDRDRVDTYGSVLAFSQDTTRGSWSALVDGRSSASSRRELSLDPKERRGARASGTRPVVAPLFLIVGRAWPRGRRQNLSLAPGGMAFPRAPAGGPLV